MTKELTDEELERKVGKLEQELNIREKSERYLRALIKNTLDTIFTIDLQGNIVFQNVVAEKLTGYSIDDLLNMNIEDLLAPEYREFIADRMNKRIRGENMPQPFSFEIIHKAGHRVPLELTTTSIYDDDKNLIGIQGVARDVTKRKQAEQEREELIQELQEALAEVKRLSGFLPICTYCKNIRDDKGYWNQIEEYIRDRSDAEFSHSICPDCLKKHFADFHKKKSKTKEHK